ncbi:MAG TPA: hypothetical protein VGG73_20140 [Vicinamibacterales bacterium]
MTATRIGVFALFLLWAPNASAQDDNKFALGAEFTIRTTDRDSKSDYARVQLGPNLLWRFGEGKPGWGFHWGLNWYSVDIERAVGGSVVELGSLHVRPVMAGYGYTYILHHITISADALAGFAFNSIDLDAGAIAAYNDRLGVQRAYSVASNTFVLKPEIGMWHNVNRKIGLNINFGYMFARPEVSVISSTGTETRTARADQFILKGGVVYSIFGR